MDHALNECVNITTRELELGCTSSACVSFRKVNSLNDHGRLKLGLGHNSVSAGHSVHFLLSMHRKESEVFTEGAGARYQQGFGAHPQ